MSARSDHKCLRCGLCCLDVGRTFWKHGNLDNEQPFADHQLLNKLANNGDNEDGGLPCEMPINIRGEYCCAIEQYAGREYKPITCRDHPQEGE